MPNTPPDKRRYISRKVLVTVMLMQTMIIALFAAGYFKLAHDNSQQNKDIQESLNNGRGLLACLIEYADDMTNALEDRDAVNSTARAAAIEWLDAIVAQADEPESPQQAQEILDLLKKYSAALKRLNDPKEFEVAPYPDITVCLRKNNLPVPEELRDNNGTGPTPTSAMEPFSVVYHEVPASSLPAADNGLPGKWDNKCLHRKVTIRGNDGDNVINGTRGRDVIFAYSGDDLVDGGRGRDRICGRYGGDTLNGGPGFDRINGGNGGGLDLCFAERTKKCP